MHRNFQRYRAPLGLPGLARMVSILLQCCVIPSAMFAPKMGTPVCRAPACRLASSQHNTLRMFSHYCSIDPAPERALVRDHIGYCREKETGGGRELTFGCTQSFVDPLSTLMNRTSYR